MLTDWVFLEIADGLCRQTTRAAVVKLFENLRNDSDVRIIRTDRQLFDLGWELYSSRMDKDWSLTDCISFVVMRQMKLKDALTADRHFEQAGFEALLK